MQQENLDKLARLHFEDEKDVIKHLKFTLNYNSVNQKNWRIYRCLRTYSELKYHKEKLMLYKRQVPLKPKEYKNYLGLLYICPCCDCELFYDHVEAIEIHKRYNTYCGRCGQRLMWE